MRLVIVKSAYPDYLRRWYRERPRENERTYGEQRTALERDAFWWGGSWSAVLPELGIEVSEIVENAQPLQRAWAREHGVALRPVAWMAEVLCRQIKAARPDAIFIQSFNCLSAELLAAIRAENPTLRAVVGWVGSPHVPARLLQACDHILTCVPELVDELREAGLSCSHMNHAFDPAVLERIDKLARKDIGFSFVGNVLNRLEHGPRADLIREVATRQKLDVFADLPGTVTPRVLVGALAAKTLYALTAQLRRIGVQRATLLTIPLIRHAAAWPNPPQFPRPPVPRAQMHPPVYGLRMFETLHRSRVTLNVHSTISPRSVSNLRTFEATGIGTCLLTDWRPNIGDLFDPDRELVTYRSVGECVDRARWLLENPADAERIAAAGRRRVLAEHTFAHRAPVLDAAIRDVIARVDRSRPRAWS